MAGNEIRCSTEVCSGALPIYFYINNFVYEIQHSQVCNFADDNTIYTCVQNRESVTSNIESGMKAAISWYKNNEMVANPEKFQLMFTGLKDDIKLIIIIIMNEYLNWIKHFNYLKLL